MSWGESIIRCWQHIFDDNARYSLSKDIAILGESGDYVLIPQGTDIRNWQPVRHIRNKTGIRIKWNRRTQGWYCNAEGFEWMYFKELSHLLEELAWHAKTSGIRVAKERWPYAATYWYITRSRGVEPRPQPSRETAE